MSGLGHTAVQVVKSLNSSVVLVVDADGKEWLLLGKGIGFGRRPGDALDARAADRAFVPLTSSGTIDHIKTLSFLTPERLKITEEIVTFAEQRLGITLNRYILVALTDHLAFVLERASSGVPVTPVLGWEIQDLYPAEYDTAAQALDIIERHTGTRLPPEEAVSITLHLVNASLTSPDMPKIAKLSELLGWFASFVAQINPDADPKAQARLVRHGRLLFQRLLDNEQLCGDVGTLVEDYAVRNPVVAEQVALIEQHIWSETET